MEQKSEFTFRSELSPSFGVSGVKLRSLGLHSQCLPRSHSTAHAQHHSRTLRVLFSLNPQSNLMRWMLLAPHPLCNETKTLTRLTIYTGATQRVWVFVLETEFIWVESCHGISNREDSTWGQLFKWNCGQGIFTENLWHRPLAVPGRQAPRSVVQSVTCNGRGRALSWQR